MKKSLLFIVTLGLFSPKILGQQPQKKESWLQKIEDKIELKYNKQQHKNAYGNAILNKWIGQLDGASYQFDIDPLVEIPQTPNEYNDKNQKIGDWIIWYDKDGKETPDSTHATMFRVVTFKKNGNIDFFSNVQDYYFPSRKLMFVGGMKSLYPKPIYNADGYWYHENGYPKEFRKALSNNAAKSIQWDTTGHPTRIDYYLDGIIVDTHAKLDSFLLFLDSKDNKKLIKEIAETVTEQDSINYGANSLEYAYSTYLRAYALWHYSEQKKAGKYFLTTYRILEKNNQRDDIWYLSCFMSGDYYSVIKNTTAQQNCFENLTTFYAKLSPHKSKYKSIDAILENESKSFEYLHLVASRNLVESFIKNNNLKKLDNAIKTLEKAVQYTPTDSLQKFYEVESIIALSTLYGSYYKNQELAKEYLRKAIKHYKAFELNNEQIHDNILGRLFSYNDTTTIVEHYGKNYKDIFFKNPKYGLSRIAAGIENLQDLRTIQSRGSLDAAFVMYNNASNDKEVSAAIKYIEKELKSLDKKGIYLIPDKITLINLLGNLYEYLDNIPKASQIYQKSFDLYKLYAKTVLDFLTEAEKNIIFAQNIIPVLATNEPNQEEVARMYDYALLKKGLVLNDTRSLIEAIYKSNNLELIDLWEGFLAEQSDLQEFKDDLKDLVLQIAALESKEKRIAQLSLPFKKHTDNLNITSKDVAKSLTQKSIAIEFSNTTVGMGESPDSSFYYTMILDSTGFIKHIPICYQAELVQILNDGGQNQEERFSTRGNTGKNSAADNHILKKLSVLIWDKIRPYVHERSTIYFSPSGLLNTIPFAAMLVGGSNADSNQTLSQKYKLVQLLSTRSVVTQQKDSLVFKPSMSFALYGGIEFGPSANSIITNAIPMQRGNFYQEQRSSSWTSIPNTKTEIDSIFKILRTKGVTQIQVQLDTSATEASIKALSNHSPDGMQLATHGYTLSTAISKISSILPQNPLLRSGIILSNGNIAWTDTTGKLRIPTENDGILTAEEIKNLNLSSTQYVVLSACETGLGEIKNSEGVFGLQRALKIAGVRYILATLWKVSDATTADFWKRFYIKWTTGTLSFRTAFIETQRDMQSINPNPYYWAGFVMVE